MSLPEFILTLSCPDAVGIVHAVTGVMVERGCNIIDSAQFGDAGSKRFFMRVTFAGPAGMTRGAIQDAFAATAKKFGMDWRITDRGAKTRTLILVSRFGHCLNDLLFRASSGVLPIDIRAVASNHTDFEDLVGAHKIPFHHLPVTATTKAAQEKQILQLCEGLDVELVVLARYMQVLSDDLCRALSGRAINIHHSFLPSFKGAKPYHQAHERGVKIVGATAHYVTSALDEGPIIEQEVVRVDHAMGPDQLVEVGRDVECVVLGRAVKLHVERRVLLNGSRTVIFR
ncbi:MAG TPA: formyltetrahydrofolate deformylase [Magnetospirillaceae bacterium]|jgi:formyltetrahydrofolate deformylase